MKKILKNHNCVINFKDQNTNKKDETSNLKL